MLLRAADTPMSLNKSNATRLATNSRERVPSELFKLQGNSTVSGLGMTHIAVDDTES